MNPGSRAKINDILHRNQGFVQIRENGRSPAARVENRPGAPSPAPTRKRALRIAVLKAGTAPPRARRRAGDYDRTMMAMLDAPGREWTSYDVEHGIFPERLDRHDAYVITGSRHSAYDVMPWIARLLETVRALHALRCPAIGICFRHQAVAQALGGEVGPNPEGWGIGARSMALTGEGLAWIGRLTVPEPLPDSLFLLESHRDACYALRRRRCAWRAARAPSTRCSRSARTC